MFNDPSFKSQVLHASKSLPRLNFIVRDIGTYNLRFHTPRGGEVSRVVGINDSHEKKNCSKDQSFRLEVEEFKSQIMRRTD